MKKSHDLARSYQASPVRWWMAQKLPVALESRPARSFDPSIASPTDPSRRSSRLCVDPHTFQPQLCLGVERIVDDHDVARSSTVGRWLETDLKRAGMTDVHDERIGGSNPVCTGVQRGSEVAGLTTGESDACGSGTDVQRYRTDVRDGHGLERALR